MVESIGATPIADPFMFLVVDHLRSALRDLL